MSICIQISTNDTLSDERVMALLREHGSMNVLVSEGGCAWNPASTKRMIYGPAAIKYVLHPDGGVNATLVA